MMSSKAKEEKISTISDPTRTQLPNVWAEENERNMIYRPQYIAE